MNGNISFSEVYTADVLFLAPVGNCLQKNQELFMHLCETLPIVKRTIAGRQVQRRNTSPVRKSHGSTVHITPIHQLSWILR